MNTGDVMAKRGEMTQSNLRLPTKLWVAMKIAAAQQHKSLTEVVEQALTEFLRRNREAR